MDTIDPVLTLGERKKKKKVRESVSLIYLEEERLRFLFILF